MSKKSSIFASEFNNWRMPSMGHQLMRNLEVLFFIAFCHIEHSQSRAGSLYLPWTNHTLRIFSPQE